MASVTTDEQKARDERFVARCRRESHDVGRHVVALLKAGVITVEHVASLNRHMNRAYDEHQFRRETPWRVFVQYIDAIEGDALARRFRAVRRQLRRDGDVAQRNESRLAIILAFEPDEAAAANDKK